MCVVFGLVLSDVFMIISECMCCGLCNVSCVFYMLLMLRLMIVYCLIFSVLSSVFVCVVRLLSVCVLFGSVFDVLCFYRFGMIM